MSDADVKYYLNGLQKLLDDIDIGAMNRLIDILKKVIETRKQIFLIGNGGSAATANHLAADLGKNAIKTDEGRPKLISLCTNISAVTAYGNDMGYENIFVEQLKNLMEKGDVVIAISASGKSPNIVKAVRYAREKEGIIIGLTGFEGGELKSLSDVNLNVNSDSYEQIEDLHLMIAHILVYCFKQFNNH